MVIPKQYRKVLKQIGHHHWFWYRIDDWAHGERYKFPNHVVAYLLNGEIITLRRGSNIIWSHDMVVETNIYDKEEIYPNCTVQVLTNTTTGEVSVGWWNNNEQTD